MRPFLVAQSLLTLKSLSAEGSPFVVLPLEMRTPTLVSLGSGQCKIFSVDLTYNDHPAVSLNKEGVY